MKIHRRGDCGDDVGLLQHRLIRAGQPVTVNYLYDDETELAVAALQRCAGLVVDGIAGPKTYATLANGQRDRKHLRDADLIEAADALGVPVACIRAVNEVESRGSGFLPDGRPVILFERHKFWQRLENHGIDPAPLAVQLPNIVSQKVGGYQGGAAEYTRLTRAERIDPVAAWESSSWGAFQIMGHHWQRLGYASADDFVAHMESNESAQLDAFVRFIAADSSLLAALKSRKWIQFAKLYNGPNYARNLYDAKLAQAYLKYVAPHYPRVDAAAA
ncbi:N-acetylmuramidase domain-containing protein [Paraburkholderia hayleyella]|uniref:N-acetylmuramidase domain-containing protein n=1 Tax=Paraburkholderia hayleyella TaxID=2152889 RepID=UPI001291708D|nr:N-acetylmuramidase family protein [Paraburkholderia hayleyella]